MPTILNLSIYRSTRWPECLHNLPANKYINKVNGTLSKRNSKSVAKMSMIPFFPNLKPSVANRFWFDIPNDDEVQTKRFEDERRNWRESMKTAATDLQPLGKVLTMPGIETDDEDANDDSEDTDSHDEEDDETNDRVIPVTQDFYSADDIQMNDETSPTAP